MQENLRSDSLKIGEYGFGSRFILGSGRYSLELIKSTTEEAKVEIITPALRRASTGEVASILDYTPKSIVLLPNISGTRNADEVLRIARFSRKLGCEELIEIEVIGGGKYLLPDNCETIKACELLAKEDSVPLFYTHADLHMARVTCDAGAAAIMPLAAPIGSSKNLCAKEFIQILPSEIDLPIIVDTDIGTPTQACEAMQMGVSAAVTNIAIAEVKDIALVTKASSSAIQAGGMGHPAGSASASEAKASSPLTDFLRD